VTLKMPAFEWVHVQLHQQKGMISLSPPTICNSAPKLVKVFVSKRHQYLGLDPIHTSCEYNLSRIKQESFLPHLGFGHFMFPTHGEFDS
uniref:hypothetical protein n=1 Tax=Shigella flexneri TaxID=623 RepID=UPI0027DC41C8